MKETLSSVARTLHDLIDALPSIRTHCSQEALARHLRLIEHFQRRYDRLATHESPSLGMGRLDH